MRTMVKNRVHALIDKYGVRCEYSDLFGKEGIQWLKSIEFPSSLDRLMLENHLQHIASLNQQIKRVNEERDSQQGITG